MTRTSLLAKAASVLRQAHTGLAEWRAEFGSWREHTARSWREAQILVRAANERAEQPEPERLNGVSLADAAAMLSHIAATHTQDARQIYTSTIARKWGAWELRLHMREAGAAAALAAGLGLPEPTDTEPGPSGLKFIWDAPYGDSGVWLRIFVFWSITPAAVRQYEQAHGLDT